MNIGDILWIGVLLLISFGGSIFKKLVSKGEGTEESSQPVSYPQWETVPDDFDQDAEEVAPADPNPYFTYEDTNVQVHTNAPATTQPSDDTLRPAAFADEAFDLRKAIIYQTILQNNYIHEK